MHRQLTHGGLSPSQEDIITMWRNLQIEPILKQSKEEVRLIDAFKKSHLNGGLMINKFHIKGDSTFDWFAQRKRLNEIYFTRKILSQPQLEQYRKRIKATDTLTIKNVNWTTDILDISGLLARINFYGGAYNEAVNAETSWKIANAFVEHEFDSKFDQVSSFKYDLEGAEWFFNIIWDVSFQLFDKLNNNLYIFDITDTD